jgi:hypothetical protein
VPSSARERVIPTQFTVLKSAAALAASRPDAKSTDVPRITEARLRWVLVEEGEAEGWLAAFPHTAAAPQRWRIGADYDGLIWPLRRLATCAAPYRAERASRGDTDRADSCSARPGRQRRY